MLDSCLLLKPERLVVPEFEFLLVNMGRGFEDLHVILSILLSKTEAVTLLKGNLFCSGTDTFNVIGDFSNVKG